MLLTLDATDKFLALEASEALRQLDWVKTQLLAFVMKPLTALEAAFGYMMAV